MRGSLNYFLPWGTFHFVCSTRWRGFPGKYCRIVCQSGFGIADKKVNYPTSLIGSDFKSRIYTNILSKFGFYQDKFSSKKYTKTEVLIPKSGIFWKSFVSACIDGCIRVHGGREKVSLHGENSQERHIYEVKITSLVKAQF